MVQLQVPVNGVTTSPNIGITEGFFATTSGPPNRIGGYKMIRNRIRPEFPNRHDEHKPTRGKRNIGLVISAVILVALVTLGGDIASTKSVHASQWPYKNCAPNTPPSSIAAICNHPVVVNTKQWPESAPGTAGISANRAIQIGVAMGSHTGNAPVSHTREMNYAQASHLINDNPNPAVAPQTQVWVVTVHQPFGFMSVPPAVNRNQVTIPQVYTVVLDAANGNPIDACGGCSAV